MGSEEFFVAQRAHFNGIRERGRLINREFFAHPGVASIAANLVIVK